MKWVYGILAVIRGIRAWGRLRLQCVRRAMKKNKEWDINWDYWEAQIEGYNKLKKKKKIWREHRNETKELIDKVYEWWWKRV